MGSETPKQFMTVAGLPVLMHTIGAFYHSRLRPEILVVLNKDYFNYWQELCGRHGFSIPHLLVEGGGERYHSVKNALNRITDKNAVVAIHDAVRPAVSGELITRSFLEAAEKGSSVCGIPSRDSVRLLKEGTSTALNRQHIFLIQTPQTFQFKILKSAYELPYKSEFTDDASVVEASGFNIHLTTGEPGNIKITYPGDINIVESLLKT